jgi:hypothetical protein
MDGDKYWPFDVLPPEQRTQLHQQQIELLETAYREGFRPYAFGGDSFGASAGDRYGYVIRRSRLFWELVVGAPAAGKLSAYVNGYDINAEAVLQWLRGATLKGVLEFIRPYLVPAGGRSSGFGLEPPEGVEAGSLG